MKRALVLLPFLLAGCQGAGDDTPTVTQPEASPSAASPASSPSSSPSAASAAPRSSPVRAVDGDVDGDGQPDTIGVTGQTLTVTLSRGGRALTTSVDTDLDGTEPAATAGSTDVDRDGHAEVFVRVAQGASTETLRMFRYDGSALGPVDTADGPLLLVVGGSTTHGDGFTCSDAGRLVVRSAASDDGTAFTVTTTTYRFSGNQAVRTARTTTKANGMDDPAVAAAYRVDCGPVGEGD